MRALLLFDQGLFSCSMEDTIKALKDGGIPDRLLFPSYFSAIGFIWYYLGVFLFLVLIQYFLSETLKKATDKVLHHTLRSIVFGLLFFTLLPVLIFLVMSTIFGIPIGLLLLIVYVVLVLLVLFISAVSVANWINRFWKWDWNFWVLCVFALAVFLVINLLLMVPVVGWIVLGTLSCMSFGGILLSIVWKINR